MVESSRASAPPPTPLWVKVWGGAFLLLALVVAALHLFGGDIGPGLHLHE